MTSQVVGQGTSLFLLKRSAIAQVIDAFLVDREAQGMSASTVTYYRKKLGAFRAYLEKQGIERLEDVTANVLRCWLIDLAKTHSPGGVHTLYAAVKAFLRWYEAEYEPHDWLNPIQRVPAPKVPTEPLEPANVDDLRKMLAVCQGKGYLASRDRALLLFLVDTGVRASELLSLNLGDLNLSQGSVLVRQGKGRKPRTVFIAPKTRKAMLAYLKYRNGEPDEAPLFASDERTRLTYSGLRRLLERRAKQAGVAMPSPHSFRRLNAILSLRQGIDLVSLSRLLGHSNLATVSRYLKQISDDLQQAHQKAGVVDRLLG